MYEFAVSAILNNSLLDAEGLTGLIATRTTGQEHEPLVWVKYSERNIWIWTVRRVWTWSLRGTEGHGERNLEKI